jgi:hypothetical protein
VDALAAAMPTVPRPHLWDGRASERIVAILREAGRTSVGSTMGAWSGNAR